MEASQLPTNYYKKARLYYKISLGIFLWISLFAPIFKQVNIHPLIEAGVTAIPMMANIYLIPTGIYSLIKSYTTKEPFNRFKIIYVAVYSLYVLFIIWIISDIVKFI
jgi:hypothetical protein